MVEALVWELTQLGLDPASPAIFLRDLGQVARSSGPPLSPLQNVMQISWCTFPVGTDQEFKSKWHFKIAFQPQFPTFKQALTHADPLA